MTAAHLKGPVVHFAFRFNCHNKLHFSTEREARQYMKGKAKLKPYKCRKCDGWHLTSEGQWKGSDLTT